MAKGITIEVKGMRELLNRIKTYSDDVQDKTDKLMGSEALDMAQRAVNDVPVDQGLLKGTISAEPLGPMSYKVSARALYAPYIEFGTKTKFNNPYPNIDSSVYKGSVGGQGGSFFDNILKWVRRKGLAATPTKSGRPSRSKAAQAQERQVAYLIYRHILKYGIKPHPFFFRNYFIATQNILKGIREIIKAK